MAAQCRRRDRARKLARRRGGDPSGGEPGQERGGRGGSRRTGRGARSRRGRRCPRADRAPLGGRARLAASAADGGTGTGAGHLRARLRTRLRAGATARCLRTGRRRGRVGRAGRAEPRRAREKGPSGSGRKTRQEEASSTVPTSARPAPAVCTARSLSFSTPRAASAVTTG
ncbi:hypothetical protein MMA15_00575 [Streptomyces sp. M600PL45_2]|uniref:Uncharacterized protein n=1 Tax=Streptomyces marispadix TaxID=2922868 RepID=A0ABS9SRR1_9ACTN|nr:hypothetical protein [Streptomyces marispadix]